MAKRGIEPCRHQGPSELGAAKLRPTYEAVAVIQIDREDEKFFHTSGVVINALDDEDYFRFEAKKGDQLTIEVAASRLGSPLDSVIEVLDAQGHPIPRATLRGVGENRLQKVLRPAHLPKHLHAHRWVFLGGGVYLPVPVVD